MSLEQRRAFLAGYLDALDALAQPSADTTDPATAAAWRAGHDHFHVLVQRERARLEAGLHANPGLPRPPSDSLGGSG